MNANMAGRSLKLCYDFKNIELTVVLFFSILVCVYATQLVGCDKVQEVIMKCAMNSRKEVCVLV